MVTNSELARLLMVTFFFQTSNGKREKPTKREGRWDEGVREDPLS